MEVQLLSSLYGWRRRNSSLFESWKRRKGIATYSSNSCIWISSYDSQQNILSVKSIRMNLISTRTTKNTKQPIETSTDEGFEKKGTIVGAIALITGTSIGSGILAIPQKTSPAGFVPSAIAMILCWGFLLIEALLLAEINVHLLNKREKRNMVKKDFEIISLRTMAQESLGEWGGSLVTLIYVFLGYTTLVAYTSKSGEIISHLGNISSNISGFLFSLLFSLLISLGGTRTTDQVNQWLTTAMIVLLIAIEVVAVSSGDLSGFEAAGNWGKVPATVPVIIFTLVYHDLAPGTTSDLVKLDILYFIVAVMPQCLAWICTVPNQIYILAVICAYLGGDLARIKVSLILGSIVPLIVLLIWDAVALSLSLHADQAVDPLELLMRVKGNGLSIMIEAFSLLAVGTSLIGTLLGFSSFFLEQLNNLSWLFASKQIQMSEGNGETSFFETESMSFGLKRWWGSNKFSIAAAAIAVGPPLFVSSTVPDVFSAATDIAGGYCMTMLYGVLPPTMAWAMHIRSSYDVDSGNGEEECEGNFTDDKRMILCRDKPALICLGLFACAIVIEQIIQDLSALCS
ncbi:Tryptophan/tyrosine permease [Thalictrum thalictroides]|uniref:Tryptophan/tyrosine permease n=1 Tax=Thalictrum thalictroides TaxID=46969 RepID=A0A7J6X5Y7_THATH|nr:Tryptophan/tyrosine permease [Thalictrum thalictroides]